MVYSHIQLPHKLVQINSIFLERSNNEKYDSILYKWRMGRSC